MTSSNRLSAVKNLQLRYDPEPFHSNQVAKLALQLFDELAPWHGLSANERSLMEAAALLHDIGYSRGNNDEHHKNSLKMILENGLPGFNPTETVIIANVARYHRKAFPSPNHRHYATLTPEAATIVRRLAAFLRIADGLDRSHRSLVSDIKISLEAHLVVFRVYHYGELRNEITAAERKADLFKAEFGHEIAFRPQSIQNFNPGKL